MSIHVIHLLLRNAHEVLGLKYLQKVLPFEAMSLDSKQIDVLYIIYRYISSRHVPENPPANNERIDFWILSKQTLSNPQACERGEWPLRQSYPLKNIFIFQKSSKNILISQKSSEEYVVSQKSSKNISIKPFE